MKFAHLHGHSTYSFLDGYGTPAQIVSRMKEIGHSCCCMTDHGNIYGHVPFQKEMKKADLRPLFGCEFYIVDDLTKRDKFNPSLGADGFPHVTVLAANQQGYENLIRLVTIASGPGFYYKSRIDWQTLAKYQEGLVVLSGCVGGYPSRLINEKGVEAAWHFIAEQQQRIERFYVELIPEPGLDISENTILPLMAIAKDLGVQTVMTADAHFPRREDHGYEDIMVCIGIGKKMADQSRTLRLPEYQYYCDADELLERGRLCTGLVRPRAQWNLHDLGVERELIDAIERTADIAETLQVEIPMAKPVAYFARKPEEDPADILKVWIEEGIDARKKQGILPVELEQQYRERADREFKVIAGKGFADYLLTITDIARWAKQQNTLVMCRGSAGGCLLLWLLQCSETDAIRHELSFERFYDETRNDPPDVDMDFETWFRPKVIEYIYSKYGYDKCSQVAALTLLRAKNAVQDVANVFGIPDSEYAPLSAELDSKDDDVDKQIEGITDPKALDVLVRYPVLRKASRLVGQVRNTTVNAAGFIISSEPLNKAIATITNGQDVQFSSVDKHGAADIGLMKLDLLGVAAFDVIGHAIRKMGMSFDDLYRMPVGDQRDMDQWQISIDKMHIEPYKNLAYIIDGTHDIDLTIYKDVIPNIIMEIEQPPWQVAYDLVQKKSVVGVFQIDGAVMMVAEKAGLNRFEELYAASALCRPGAMNHVPEYAKNKHSAAEFAVYLQKLHPIARDIVKSTYGILVYQEQVMAICRLMGKMPWPQIHKLRKRIASASFHGFALGPEYSDDFFRGCEETGVSRREAEFWWEAIKAHGIYSFNKSHCVTYGIVGYWMLWLKANHPEAYYESFLQVEGESNTINAILQKRLVKEYTAGGGKMLIVDPATSRESFHSPRPGLIVGGWGNLRGIGKNTAAQIMAKGPFEGWADFRDKVPQSLYYKLFETGMTEERDPDIHGMIELASWIPVPSTGPKELAAISKHKNMIRPGKVPNRPVDGDIVVCGYLTAKHKRGRTGQFRGEQIDYVLEDDTGMIIMRVSRKMSSTIGQRLKKQKMGDYLAVRGWWPGECMFVKEYVVISTRN